MRRYRCVSECDGSGPAGTIDRAGRSRAEDRYQDAAVVVESKRFGLPLDARDKDTSGQAGTPHGQLLRYLATAAIISALTR